MSAMFIMRNDLDPSDYSVVVKLRADSPTPWRWEIYCAGKQLPVERSAIFFETPRMARVAGKAALAQLMEKLNF